ncbi:hypothetical protein HPP92_019731 [Vanilla planifolia]|uniref:Uncharacterized protein n=1 Tax=Vanilla planifolia TaxID=51239 RepID=A0A835Q9C9_VANPL|nr:hypothetical protein HPP92_019731 [Vanilla planifolia]
MKDHLRGTSGGSGEEGFKTDCKIEQVVRRQGLLRVGVGRLFVGQGLNDEAK